MTGASFDLGEPDGFTAGAVGPKGQRVFYLQAREGRLVVTLKLEKQQVGALADYLEQIYSLPQLRSERIKAVVWFNLQDNASWPAGLLREDGSRKPSYDRFVRVVKDQGGTTLG